MSHGLALYLLIIIPTACAAAKPVRSAAEVIAFKRGNPCPSTGLRSGACPGHQVDHAMQIVGI